MSEGFDEHRFENNSIDRSIEEMLSIRPKYQSYSIDGEGIFLVNDNDHQIFEGDVYTAILPLLTMGIYSEGEIADKLEADYSREVIHFAIKALVDKKIISYSTRDSSAEGSFWDNLELDSATAKSLLCEATVIITKIGDVDPEPLAKALTLLGIMVKTGREATNEKLQIVITDDYLNEELREISDTNLNDGRPWLLARMTGTEIYVGPFFHEKSGCWECLATRLRTNRFVENFLERKLKKKGITKTISSIPVFSSLAVNFISIEVMKFITGIGSNEAFIVTLDILTMQTTRHPFDKRPQCTKCGNPGLQGEIMTRPVSICDDDATWENLEAIISYVDKLTGIITSLTTVNTGLPTLFSYAAFFGFGRGARDFEGLKNSLLSQAAGVGADKTSAKIGAICEAIERYSGMYAGDEPSIQASYLQLEENIRIHPNLCMLYSDAQYQDRHLINASGSAFTYIPEPFDESRIIEWTGIWSITKHRFKLVPTSYLFYYYPESTRESMCWADSNGCAAGKSITDAVRRGLYEVIERDSVAIWWYNRLKKPGVDLASFQYQYFDSFVRDYLVLNRDVWVLDITTDLGIPSFVAISKVSNGNPEDILIAFGCHLSAKIAIERALCEMNHLLPAVLPSNKLPTGDYPYPDRSQIWWWKNATVKNQDYLLPQKEVKFRTAAEYDLNTPESYARQVQIVCDILAANGLEVFVANQSRPDIKVPVVKVIVPGTRHFWTRFAPGRLYDIPVKMGWLEKPQNESDLNPIAMFV